MRVDANEFRGGHRWGSAHSIHLGTALELGEELGYAMPSECVVYAVEADDVETFGEELSPPVAAAADEVVELVTPRWARGDAEALWDAAAATTSTAAARTCHGDVERPAVRPS